MWRFVPAAALAALAAVPAPGQPPAPVGPTNWAFDELTLVNGAKFQGLIVYQVPDGVRFQSVSRPPGRPTITFTSFFGKSEVAAVKPLSEKDREVLKERLAELDPSGAGERARMEALELVDADWPGRPNGGREYISDYFTLVSTGSEELTRRAAVRLEQVYAAFARFLPPAAKGGPTRVLLATDRNEYKALLGPHGGLLHAAVFDPAANRVLCGSDLKQLGTELQSARIHHSQQLAALDKYDETVRKLYREAELGRHLKAVGLERGRVVRADRENLAKFDAATARLFAVLYHEAFHAYAGAFAYPPLRPDEVKAGKGTGELPRWLNEGLAQVFETAVVEAGELRADAPDKDRLARVKDWLKGKAGSPRVVPLADLLAAGGDAFLAAHADAKAAADRAYLSSWALAYYLTFDRRVVGTKGLREYLVAVNSGGDPRGAFAKLVGQELPTFEADWHAYLLRLRPDGTAPK